MQSLSHSVYSQLPETEEIKFAKAVADLQSEVCGQKLQLVKIQMWRVRRFLFCFFSDKVQKVRQTGGWQLSVLCDAPNSGNATRQAGL